MGDTTIPVPCDFDEFSKVEQIRYVQDLWDRISARPEELPVRTSHVDLAEARLAVHRQAPHTAQPARDTIERLRDRKR